VKELSDVGPPAVRRPIGSSCLSTTDAEPPRVSVPTFPSARSSSVRRATCPAAAAEEALRRQGFTTLIYHHEPGSRAASARVASARYRGRLLLAGRRITAYDLMRPSLGSPAPGRNPADARQRAGLLFGCESWRFIGPSTHRACDRGEEEHSPNLERTFQRNQRFAKAIRCSLSRSRCVGPAAQLPPYAALRSNPGREVSSRKGPTSPAGA
jgi:hypothetical protein